VFREEDGRTAELGRVGPGDHFSEHGLHGDLQQAVSAVTTCTTLLRRLDRDAFESIFGPLRTFKRRKNSLQGILSTINSEPAHSRASAIPLTELTAIGVLGQGSFGRVTLVEGPDRKRYALKAVSKQQIVEAKQKAHIFNEKNAMLELDHPFITKLYTTYQDHDLLYFLLEPSLGGELFPILRRAKYFPAQQAMFYSGCVILAFEYMHRLNYVYRDLKPENLLVDHHGYCKVLP
jgi:cGMP-dependent protein kinase